MSSLAKSILSAAQSLPEGRLLSPKEFLHLGSRAAVDQTLTRLVREGGLLRVGRGMYALPIQSRFGVRPPATQAVVMALEAAQGDVIVDSGATEANALGLTTQVPVREVFLTSGPSRTLQLGSRTVELQHAKRWLLALGKRPAGQAIRALSWLGPEHGAGALKRLYTQLAAEEWTAIRSATSMLPSWMARAVGEVSEAHAHG
ncbi:MAG: type IV toxin-antitoxin system AbiEi family antitoxin domain-containing protein [Candidatus Saccharibacteria bacterium]|nr:type IV toxin-antitoxin system AbiEi family antitoxin domain-containing protein [Rhodoferax sp.]